MNHPTVSVVLAVHNGEEFIRATLDSVLNQTYSDWECIIINDFSTDGTQAILQEYAARDARFRVHGNEVNLRLARSLNVGLELAQGKYVVRLDADDLQLPTRFEKQVAFMDAHPEIALSYPRHYILRDGVLTTGCCGRYTVPAAISAMLLFFNPVLHPGVIARREVMLKYRYDPAFTCSEDMELWTRMIEAGEKIACQEEFLSVYRLHGGQITATTKPAAKVEVVQILRRYYKKTLGIEDDAFIDFFIQNVYFHEHDDLGKLLTLYRRVMQANRNTKTFEKKYILCAVIELVSESKRKNGIPKSKLYQLLRFGGLSFVAEFIKRKKRIQIDLEQSVTAAEQAGYRFIEKIDGIIPSFK